MPVPPARSSGRRSLVPLAGLLALALVTNGVIGLFGVWSVHRQHERALSESEALTADLDRARAAQVALKTQVQEWKNMLLRGSDPADMARYRAAFETEGAAVQQNLRTLAAAPGALGEHALLLAEHAELMRRYATAIAGFAPDDPLSARRVDAGVRGIDRRMLEETDGLIAQMRERAATIQRETQATVRARYAALRQSFIWGLAACIGLVALFLWFAVRSERRG